MLGISKNKEFHRLHNEPANYSGYEPQSSLGCFFASHQIDARHWSDIGDPRDTDETILDRALDFDACVMTQDLDFGTIIALRQLARPSVIQVRSPLNLPDQIGDLVFNAIQSNEVRLQTGALMTIEPPQFRIRDLPII